MSAPAAAEAAERWVVDVGDCITVMRQLPNNCVDAIVTDPPYGMSQDPDIEEVLRHWLAGDRYEHGGGGFMGKTWDSFVPGPEYWRECFRVLKPGGHLLAFAATRTYDLMSIAIRFARFEVRDMIEWLYGTGFPKSLNVGQGRGTALKPGHEPIVMARKPLDGTVAANLTKWGTGALNIDACRIAAGDDLKPVFSGAKGSTQQQYGGGNLASSYVTGSDAGRWPANVILDEDAAAELDAQSGTRTSGNVTKTYSPKMEHSVAMGAKRRHLNPDSVYADSGGASRFFYVAKASRAERDLGCGHLPPRETKETVDRDPDSAGVQNPRAGAGRGAGAPIYRCSACGLNLGGGRAASACPKGPEHVRELVGHGAAARNHHPTVKPVALMRYLVRLVTPPGGSVLDPFCGSGTTGMAAVAEGFEFMGIEQDPEYAEIARARIAAYEKDPSK